MNRQRAIVFASWSAALGLCLSLVVDPIAGLMGAENTFEPDSGLLMAAVAALLGAGATRAYERKQAKP